MKKLQSGRSMIEMLGVLAIIGVLSIGGLAAYNTAMDRYAANEILDFARMAQLAATEAANGGAACTATPYDASLATSLGTVTLVADTCTYTINVKDAGAMDVIDERSVTFDNVTIQDAPTS